MKIKTDNLQLLREGEELLDVSRVVRRCGAEIENLRALLGRYTQMKGCCRELMKQSAAITETTARLALLSSALMDIANVYGRSERKNTVNTEGYSNSFSDRSQVQISSVPKNVIEQLNKLLY